MKFGLPIALLLLATLGGALYITNPSEDDYAAYLSDQVSFETQNALCDPEGFSNWLGKVGEALSSACQEILAGGQQLSEDEITQLIKDSTDRQNRYLFSTYHTETPVGDYRAIGIFDRFYLQDSPSLDTVEETDVNG